MIKIDKISMNYGELKAVDKLSLHVKKGEIYAFLGPNAAGKTTTIMIVTGLIKPKDGNVEICGIDLKKNPTAAKSLIGFIPDVVIFYEKLTPVEFMEFIGNLYKIPEHEIQQKTNELFAKFHLDDYREELISQLSHGTRQRLAIASAILHKPKVLIIDEPMVGLDPIHTRIIKSAMKEFVKDGNCIFMSTHLLNVASELADRIGILNNGKLIAEGNFDAIKKQTQLGKNSELEDVFLSLIEEEKTNHK